MSDIGTIFLAVLLARVGKHPWSTRSIVLPCPHVRFQFLSFGTEQYSRGCTIRKVGSETSWSHTFEPQSECTLHKRGLDNIVGIEECGAASGTVVVDIRDRDPRHAEIVEGALDEQRLVRGIESAKEEGRLTCPLVESP